MAYFGWPITLPQNTSFDEIIEMSLVKEPAWDYYKNLTVTNGFKFAKEQIEMALDSLCLTKQQVSNSYIPNIPPNRVYLLGTFKFESGT